MLVYFNELRLHHLLQRLSLRFGFRCWGSFHFSKWDGVFHSEKHRSLGAIKSFRVAQLKAFLSEASIMQTGILLHAVVTKGVRVLWIAQKYPVDPC